MYQPPYFPDQSPIPSSSSFTPAASTSQLSESPDLYTNAGAPTSAPGSWTHPQTVPAMHPPVATPREYITPIEVLQYADPRARNNGGPWDMPLLNSALLQPTTVDPAATLFGTLPTHLQYGTPNGPVPYPVDHRQELSGALQPNAIPPTALRPPSAPAPASRDITDFQWENPMIPAAHVPHPPYEPRVTNNGASSKAKRKRKERADVAMEEEGSVVEPATALAPAQPETPVPTKFGFCHSLGMLPKKRKRQETDQAEPIEGQYCFRCKKNYARPDILRRHKCKPVDEGGNNAAPDAATLVASQRAIQAGETSNLPTSIATDNFAGPSAPSTARATRSKKNSKAQSMTSEASASLIAYPDAARLGDNAGLGAQPFTFSFPAEAQVPSVAAKKPTKPRAKATKKKNKMEQRGGLATPPGLDDANSIPQNHVAHPSPLLQNINMETYQGPYYDTVYPAHADYLHMAPTEQTVPSPSSYNAQSQLVTFNHLQSHPPTAYQGVHAGIPSAYASQGYSFTQTSQGMGGYSLHSEPRPQERPTYFGLGDFCSPPTGTCMYRNAAAAPDGYDLSQGAPFIQSHPFHYGRSHYRGDVAAAGPSGHGQGAHPMQQTDVYRGLFTQEDGISGHGNPGNLPSNYPWQSGLHLQGTEVFCQYSTAGSYRYQSLHGALNQFSASNQVLQNAHQAERQPSPHLYASTHTQTARSDPTLGQPTMLPEEGRASLRNRDVQLDDQLAASSVSISRMQGLIERSHNYVPSMAVAPPPVIAYADAPTIFSSTEPTPPGKTNDGDLDDDLFTIRGSSPLGDSEEETRPCEDEASPRRLGKRSSLTSF